MRLYRLTPVDWKFEGWSVSAYKGCLIVRAASEAQARTIATHGFAKAVLVKAGEATSANPWSEESVVVVTEIQDSRFSPAGIAEVLDPVGY